MSTSPQPSKKERREAAREARVQAEQEAAAKATRQKRLLVILGGVAAVAVIAVVLIVTTSGKDGPSGAAKNSSAKVEGVPEMTSMLAGLPQSGITIGKPTAKVKVVEFIDAQCPICQEFANNVFPTIAQDYIRTGKIQYETRTLHFLDNNFGTTDSQRGAQWLNAAGFQNKMYNAIALLYSNHGEEGTKWITDAYLRKISAAIPGLNVNQVMTQMNSAKAKALVVAADAAGTKYSVSGTPTLLVGKNDNSGTLTPIQANSVTDPSEYTSGIDAALKISGGSSSR
jgi:protein-disulfide isomerase